MTPLYEAMIESKNKKANRRHMIPMVIFMAFIAACWAFTVYMCMDVAFETIDYSTGVILGMIGLNVGVLSTIIFNQFI